MSSNLIKQPYEMILDPTGGGGRAKPVANGKFYVGEIDKDPVANPRTDIAYRDESGQERPLTSPLTLNNSGAFVVSKNDGTIIQPYMKDGVGFSVLIQDARGRDVYSNLNSGDPGNLNEKISELTGIIYKASGGNTAIENMILNAKVGHYCIIGSSRWERTSNSNNSIDDFLLITSMNNAEDVGVVYNSESSAASNFEIIVRIANSGGKTLLINDDLFCEATPSSINSGIALYFTPGKSITWSGSEAFLLDTGAYWIERNSKHKSNSTFKYMGYSANDNFVPHLQFDGSAFDGDIYFEWQSDLNKNPEDPTVDRFGFGYVRFKDVEIKNRTSIFWFSNSLPYERKEFSNLNIFNFGFVAISLPVQNSHPYYREIQRSMLRLTVSDSEARNPNERFGDEGVSAVPSSYHCLCLWEGNTLVYKNNNVRELKTKNGTACYGLYQAGLTANLDYNTETDVYAFNHLGEPNAGIKFKKALNSEIDYHRHIFTSTFFDRILADFGFKAESSNADWVTYSIEADEGARRYSLTNSRIEMPLLRNAQLSPQLISELVYRNNEFICRGEGQFNLISVLWGDDNAVLNRNIICTDNKIYAPNCDASVLCNLALENNRQGMTIELKNNSIDAKGVREFACNRSPSSTFDISSASIDRLTIDNDVRATETYDMITPYNRYPAFKEVYFGNQSVHSANYLSSIRGLNLQTIPSGSLSGSYTHNFTSGSPSLTAFFFRQPKDSYIGIKRYILSGKIIDDNGVNEFYINLQITAKTDTTIDFSYTDTGGNNQSLTWTGNQPTLNANVNSKHPTLGARILRSSGEMRVSLDVNNSGPVSISFDVYIM